MREKNGERHLRRKWTVRANGRQVVLLKKPVERAERFLDQRGEIHVTLDALTWRRFEPNAGG